MTHDIRAPEAERFLQNRGQAKVGPIKLDRVYGMGGFDLMRRTVEDASGLAIDFQLAFKESAIERATDNVFGGLDVNVPLPFKVNAFYLDDVKYPGGEFQQGVQHLSGIQVIQFIKTVPVEENYDPRLEHNARKHLVFRSIMDSLKEHSGDVAFLGRAALFFSSQVSQDAMAYDFDLKTLLVDNLRGMMADLRRADATRPGDAERGAHDVRCRSGQRRRRRAVGQGQRPRQSDHPARPGPERLRRNRNGGAVPRRPVRARPGGWLLDRRSPPDRFTSQRLNLSIMAASFAYD